MTDMTVKILILIAILLCALYLFLIAPRTKRHRPDSSVFTVKDFAHRGLHDNGRGVPENSLAAFKAAVDAGYGIELDIHITADGGLVVFHDDRTGRLCDADVAIEKLDAVKITTLRLLGTNERIPTFNEVLKLVDGKVPLIIELKGGRLKPDVAAAAADALSDYKGLYCIESFNPLYLRWYKKNKPEVLRGQLSTDFMRSPDSKPSLRNFVLSRFLLNFLSRPDFLSFDFHYRSMFTFRLCSLLFSPLLAAWTVKSRDDYESAKAEFDVFIFEGFYL